MMAPCDLCYDLDLNRLAQRVLPHYDKSRPPTELGMGLQYLDASAAGGCKIAIFYAEDLHSSTLSMARDMKSILM
jgi:hypothetical protein